MAYGGKGTLAPCKNKLMKTIIDNGRTNIVTLQSRTLYYAGTYTITCDPMPMSIEELMMLPTEVCTLFPTNLSLVIEQLRVLLQAQRCLAAATSGGQKTADVSAILSDYQSGLLTALRYQARRVDFDQTLDHALRSIWTGR